MKELFARNTPSAFWRFTTEISDEIWRDAIVRSVPLLGVEGLTDHIDDIEQLVLGEGQFGVDHWRLSPLKLLYYELKPFLPRMLTRRMRQLYQPLTSRDFPLGWPLEKRYALFLWEVGRQVVRLSGKDCLEFIPFWPSGRKYALVLTHDIETARGQDHVRRVADFEEGMGFRSSFNFVSRKYKIEQRLIDELKERGFEVGLHGLKHDGKLFRTHKEFERRARLINKHLKELDAVGFRSPLTHRNPEWMQILEVEYDLSFFDSDPFEPIPGGTMSLWPFFIGHFVELPYTLVQDYTLVAVLGEATPSIWFEKINFIEKYHGMALINSHPDYLLQKNNWDVYCDFLTTMNTRTGYWHALPKEVARWWRSRSVNRRPPGLGDNDRAFASLADGELMLDRQL